MKQDIELLSEEVEKLEKDHAASNRIDKNDILKLLAKLKHHQDEPENEAEEDYFEDLIYRVIIILGEFETN